MLPMRLYPCYMLPVGLNMLPIRTVSVLYVTCRTVSEREYLAGEVMLMQLASLAQVPAPHRVVEPARPQPRAVPADVYARGAVCVT